jgi:polyisoprenoid-binding protein YceI
MLKGILLLSIVLLGTQSAVYTPTDNGSSVKFKIKNLGVSVGGSFTGLQGKIVFDPVNPAASSMEASIDVNSINTGIDLRDNHLRSDDYFDAKNYPKIRFVSTRVGAGNRSGSYNVTGNLTIKNVTREISFPFTAVPQSGGYLFSGEFKINRRDYKVGGSSITLSDNLTVSLKVFAPKG